MTFKSAPSNIFSMLFSDASTQIASIYYENNEKLWQKTLYPFKTLLLSCIYVEEWLYTNYVSTCLVHMHIYQVEFEERAYIFKCISAVNNDSCKIKAKCLHSFLLIL